MKKFFFMSKEIFILLVVMNVTAFLSFSFLVKTSFLFLTLFVLFLFRRRLIPFQNTLKNNGEIYLSPVFGTIKSVRYNIECDSYQSPCHEIRISLSFFDEKGIYLPTTAEVSLVREVQGQKIHRGSDPIDFLGPSQEIDHIDLKLLSKNRLETLIRFVTCTMGITPSLWLKMGDRGRAAAEMGFYPLGGSVLVYLPAESDILVFENEKVIPGQTVLAAIKDNQTPLADRHENEG